MTEPLIAVIDVETTGLPPDAAVCEVATAMVSYHGGGWSNLTPIAQLANPGRFIPPEASAVHHITDADVKDEIDAEVVLRGLQALDCDIWAAHYAKFERAFFDPPGARWICTWKCALRQWPHAPSHGNQAWLTMRTQQLDRPAPPFDPKAALPPTSEIRGP